MPEPFIGEIRMFAGNYAPPGWAFCNGQLLPISQNTALFSILGTLYGGNGVNTFALPNLSGSAPMHQGAGPGLTPRATGDMVGKASVALTTQEMPMHNHQMWAVGASGSTGNPEGNVFAEGHAAPHQHPPNLYADAPNVTMSGQALASSGGSQPHNNMQPFLGVNFIIALQGEFPSRS